MSVSLKAKIAEVFDEPGCDKNQDKSEKERKKGCAFEGAKIALQPIADVAHLVHGPIACEGNSWDNRHSGSSGSQLYRTGFTTDINELDKVYSRASPAYNRSVRPRLSATAQHTRLVAPDDLAATKSESIVLPINVVPARGQTPK